MKTHFLTTSILGAITLSLSACATAPRQKLTDSKATVRAAEEVGAPKYPRASYHLKLAQDQIAVAEPLVEGSSKDKKAAERVLERAEADAELALRLAQSEVLRAEAKETWAEVQALKTNQ